MGKVKDDGWKLVYMDEDDTDEMFELLEKYEESSKQIHEIMSELFAEKYEINSDLVEARSAAIVASIIFDEIMEGTD